MRRNRNFAFCIAFFALACVVGCVNQTDDEKACPPPGVPDESKTTAAPANDSAGELAVASPRGDISRTFSIVAVDPESGVCGAAVASKYPAVGAVVPFARGGAGAFCTQHYHHPQWGQRALELLEADKSPADILAELTRDDDRPGGRQLAIIDRHGRTAQHNPTDAGAGSRWWGAMSGRYYACQGNTLTGPAVVTAMATAYETSEGSLADRLVAALVAGDCAGGDHRGRLAAGIVVDKPGSKEQSKAPWLELRVDKSDDAVIELAKKYVVLEHEAKGAWSAGMKPWKHPCENRAEPVPPTRAG